MDEIMTKPWEKYTQLMIQNRVTIQRLGLIPRFQWFLQESITRLNTNDYETT